MTTFGLSDCLRRNVYFTGKGKIISRLILKFNCQTMASILRKAETETLEIKNC